MTILNTSALKSFGSLYGNSTAMLSLYEQIERLATTDATALIIGESGTGKELIARTIHDFSLRANKPFIAFNCGAIPENLLETELFGHEKGSFTGATQSRAGHFEQASSGTLFLDEMTEMSLTQQVKFLRALETGFFFRVGGSVEMRSDVRVIATTNRDPWEAIKEGILREDLLYRLAVCPLRAPPLREREDDVEFLAHLFLTQFNDQQGTKKTFSKHTLKTLKNYEWPGNVRELKNAVYRAYILAETMVEIPPPTGVDSNITNMPNLTISSPLGEVVTIPIGSSLANAQKQMITATLKHWQGDKKKAAHALGVSLKTLYNRLEEYEEGSKI